MTWRDDEPGGDDHSGRLGRPGGDWRGIRPTLDNPMTWALSLGRFAGIAVRIHLIFLLFVLVQLARSIAVEDGLGPAIVAARMTILFGIVLFHEFGHCFACRRVDGEADEILMWPLGGLAYCLPPQRWGAHLVTAGGGPAVNVVICFVLAPVLWMLTGRFVGVALPNPLGWPALGDLQVGGAQPWWLLVIFIIHQTSFLLLLFNLLPMFPLDGGRIVQAVLWRGMGYVRSMRMSVRVGYFGAIALGLFGAIFREWMLIGIALFGGITCYMTHKQLEWTQETLGFEDDNYAISLGTGSEDDALESPPRLTRADRKLARAKDVAAAEETEIDRILAKIASTGIESLTGGEKRLLQRATERKKQRR